MPTFRQVTEIKDRPWNRAVKVVIIAPDDVSVLNVQELAERAWRSIGKKITIDGVTVKVEAFRR
jgi:divalent metal cation (Fe/Co/Zn/Cd) transporter